MFTTYILDIIAKRAGVVAVERVTDERAIDDGVIKTQRFAGVGLSEAIFVC